MKKLIIEMEICNKTAIEEFNDIYSSISYKGIVSLTTSRQDQLDSFPLPINLWIDAIHDCRAQLDSYNHIAPVKGKRILQVGGKGTHVVKFLLAGAKEAWLVSPMIGEIMFSKCLASAVGVSDRLYCVSAIAEKLPFIDGYFDAIYSCGCMHHTDTSVAFPEIARVLRDGGKFSTVEPWHTPVYDLGKKIFGQREVAYCHPLTKQRIEPLRTHFSSFKVIHHGALLRYPLLVLDKFGIKTSLRLSWRLSQVDNFLSGLLPSFRNSMGECLVKLHQLI